MIERGTYGSLRPSGGAAIVPTKYCIDVLILNMDTYQHKLSAAPFRGCCPSVSRSPKYLGSAHHRKFIAITTLTSYNNSALAEDEK